MTWDDTCEFCGEELDQSDKSTHPEKCVPVSREDLRAQLTAVTAERDAALARSAEYAAGWDAHSARAIDAEAERDRLRKVLERIRTFLGASAVRRDVIRMITRELKEGSDR